MNRLIYKGVVIFLVCLALFSWTEAHAGYLDQWQWRSPLPQGNVLNAVTLGNGTIVAVGNAGAIVTSSDGIHWTLRTSPALLTIYGVASNDLRGVAYGNNTFIAVGSSGILTSPDGITWSAKSSLHELNDISYGNNTFVATTTDSGVILTSPDGIIWTEQNASGTSINFCSIIYSNNTFYALGTSACIGWCIVDPNTYVYSSPDGVVWTAQDTTTNFPLLTAVQGNGVYLKISDYAASVFISSDGVTWTDSSLPYSPLHYKKIYFAKGLFIVVGLYGYIATSPDGSNWTLVTSRPLQPIREIAYGNGAWVAAGGSAISTSSNGISWTPQYTTTGPNDNLVGLAYGNNTFVATGVYNAVLTSPNGREWIKTTLGFGFGDIVFGNGKFVGVSGNSLVTSPDGISWTVRASYPPIQYTGTRFSRITFGNGIFAVIGSDSEQSKDVVYTSPDGVSWTRHVLNTGEWYRVINDICYGNNTFLIVGNSGYVYSSSDGANWSVRQVGGMPGVPYGDRYGVTYGDGSFVAVGKMNTKGTIWSSPDGITWTVRKSIANSDLYYVASVNHTFIVSSQWGDVLQSASDDTPDLFTFTQQTGVALNSLITSNTITASGIYPTAPISITGGTYSINGGPYTNADGTVNNGDAITVQMTSSGNYATTTNVTLTIGDVSNAFSVITLANPSGDISGGGGGCFIATAAFGSPMERHVQILRNFRDQYLLTFRLGQNLVKIYYQTSPAIAGTIAQSEVLRMMTRWCLIPIVSVAYLAVMFGIIPTLLIITTFFLILFLLIWLPRKKLRSEIRHFSAKG